MRSSAAGRSPASSRRAPATLLTPYFAYGTDPIYPANTGRGLETVPFFGESWRPDVVGPVEGERTRSNWYDLSSFVLPAEGTTGNAKRGIIEGPGNWVVNLGVYKTVFHNDRINAEFRATFENVLNHPQFQITQESAVPRPDRLPDQRHAGATA